MGRNKDELIKLAEKITGQECKDVLTKKDALKKIACYYLGEEKEFASIADCLESIVEHGASGGGSGASDKIKQIVFTNFPDKGAVLSYNAWSSWDKSNFQYITLAIPSYQGNIAELPKITREQLFNAKAGDKLTLKVGSFTATFTINTVNVDGGDSEVRGTWSGEGYGTGFTQFALLYVY